MTQITLVVAQSVQEVTGEGPAHAVDFTVLQLNDTYDAMPVEGGRRGGLARVATLYQRLREENPNTFSVMIGDFLAPSAIGAITGDSGLHMVEALNAFGLTYATMGNHEFDVPEDDFRQRIKDSDFKWIVSNVKDGKGAPFEGVQEREIITFHNGRGDSVRVAILGVCTDMVKKPWLTYESPIASAKRQVEELGDSADVFVTMTHLPMAQDHVLGAEVPRLDVLLGGHEHEAATAIVGDDATPIFKADSNARSAFVHRFRFDPETKVTTVYSEIVDIDAKLEEEPKTAEVVRGWQNMAYATLRAQGHEPMAVVGATAEPLNGAEADIRKGPTNLGQLVAETFLAEVPEADGAYLIAGLFRIDGVIPPGEILYYDVVRIFPVGGKLSVLKMPGSLLRMLLDMGSSKVGDGSFPVLAKIARTDDGWTIGGAPMKDDQLYTVVYPEFPAAYFAYPPFKGSGASKLYDTRGVREIFTDRLRRDLVHAATGTPCWAALGTSSVADAKRFYGAVFGWEFEVEPGGTTVAKANGQPVARIDELSKGAATRPGWMPYFASCDVGLAADRLQALGGKVLADPVEVSPGSRLLLAADRSGAAFGLWQREGLGAFAPDAKVGTVCWREVVAPDVDAAEAFYGALLGLEVRPFLGLGESYDLLRRGNKPVCRLTQGDGTGSWTHHFLVANVEETVKQIKASGGSIVEHEGTPFAKIVTVADPWGAKFAIVQALAPAPATGANL
ncbi:5'-nucleotidase C-terminal domain-containing protein [Paraliomyxa miuraensis]|uniref:5'-nucleotidase C-terminal domain-containing protein n=1 Tax=Paraliomyxa miuraensis TaxID=376150 RepID=UPI002252A9B7|nr:5'-nucleotidase C-terminal domain-containing protein [Paraliomyxa miuraensis]MCX4246650.1 5'-nucleotidase C-terminal domain-containing protein [Paraliomyxa miuraensis]